MILFPLWFVSFLGGGESAVVVHRSHRIVGGTPVNPGDISWQVSFQKTTPSQNTTHFCGGSLIKESWVLTAAHCFASINQSDAIAVLGGWNLLEENSKFRILKIFKHDFIESTLENDIALVKLDINNPVVKLQSTEEKMKPSIIALDDVIEVPRNNCIISGWGKLRTDEKPPNILQAATISLVPDARCKAIMKKVFKTVMDKNVCAGGDDIDTCQGDSGGPLVCCHGDVPGDVKSCRLTGITSWGIGCAVSGMPGVYTEVAHYKSWIETIIAENDDDLNPNPGIF